MKDFCNVAERDCIRLIVAQDLKESGIDIDSSSLNTGNFSSNNMTTSINMSHNQSHLSSHHHYLSTNKNLLNTSLSSNQTNTLNSKYYHHHHGDLNSQHDSQLLFSSSNATATMCSTKTFGIELRSLEMVNITCNDQILSVPW